jgi:hypothetical protein
MLKYLPGAVVALVALVEGGVTAQLGAVVVLPMVN